MLLLPAASMRVSYRCIAHVTAVSVTGTKGISLFLVPKRALGDDGKVGEHTPYESGRWA